MPNIVMVARSSMDADIGVSGQRVLQPAKGWKHVVSVEFDSKIIKEVERDSGLLKEMKEVAEKTYKQTCDAIKSKYTNAEKGLQAMVDKGGPKDQVQKSVEGLSKAIEEERKAGVNGAQQGVEGVWKKWAGKNKAYGPYRIKVVVTSAGAAAGLTFDIGLLAHAPFKGGARAAEAMLEMWKKALALGKEAVGGAAEVEKPRAALRDEMKALKEIAREGKAGVGGEKEEAAHAGQRVVEQAQPRLKVCDAQLNTIVRKATGVEAKAYQCAKALRGMLEKQEALRTEFMKEAKARLEKHPSRETGAQIKQIEGKLKTVLGANESKAGALVEKAEALHKRLKDGKKEAKRLKGRVERIRRMRGTDLRLMEQLANFADAPLEALDGKAMATAAEEIAQGLTAMAGAMLYEKISGAALEKTLLL